MQKSTKIKAALGQSRRQSEERARVRRADMPLMSDGGPEVRSDSAPRHVPPGNIRRCRTRNSPETSCVPYATGAVLKGNKKGNGPSRGPICFVVKTWARLKTTRSTSEQRFGGWQRLVVGCGWWWLGGGSHLEFLRRLCRPPVTGWPPTHERNAQWRGSVQRWPSARARVSRTNRATKRLSAGICLASSAHRAANNKELRDQRLQKKNLTNRKTRARQVDKQSTNAVV